MTVTLLRAGLAVSLLLILSLKLDFASSKTIICYATNWPQYRPGKGKFGMSDIDPTKCTHMVFAFAKVVGNRLAHYEENDIGENGQYKQFTSLKKQHPNVKTLLAVGGWNHGGDPFSTMTATQQGRSEFVRTTVDYLRQYDFDGLDVDWEYPKAKDKRNLVSLLQELRQAFDAEANNGKSELLLFMAVAAGLQNAVPAYDVPALNRYLDFISVMTYDYHGAWENKTGLLAPLHSQPGDDLSMTISLDWWVRSGASKDKLHIGLALYGRTWKLANSGDTAIGSVTVDKGPVGRFTREPGVLSHYEICERLQSGRYKTVMDPVGQMNYAFDGQEWMTYEDTVSIANKVQFILDNGFAGAMVWSFDQDDFKGEFCRRGPYPLMTIVADKLLNAGPNNPASRPYPKPQPQPQPGQGHPTYPQPGNGRPTYPQPGNGLPTYSQPGQGRPTYSQPGNGRPTYSQPGNGRPTYFQPGNGRPTYSQPGQGRPSYPQPGNGHPTYSQPGNGYGFQTNPQTGYGHQNYQQTEYRRPPYFQRGSQRHPQGGSQNQMYRQPSEDPSRREPMVSPEQIAQGSAPPKQCPPVPVTAQRAQPVFIAGQTFNCPATNGKFAHASSCEYYYFCLFRMPFRERCPLYSLFNPYKQDCECIASSTYICPAGRTGHPENGSDGKSAAPAANAPAAANGPTGSNTASSASAPNGASGSTNTGAEVPPVP